MVDILYVHIPDDTRDKRRLGAALVQELEMVRLPLIPTTIYVACHHSACLDLVTHIAKAVDGSRITEFTFEGSCSSLDPSALQTLASIPVNRLCLTSELDEVDQLPGVVAEATRLGFKSMAVDLYVDLATCSSKDWKQALQVTIDTRVGHVGTYSTSEGGEQELERLEEAEQRLEAAGYEHYELWSHALPGYRSQFQSTAWSLQGFIGLGPSAASSCGIRRWTNQSDLDAYCAALERGEPPPREVEVLQPIDLAAEALAFGPSLLDGVDPAGIEAELLRQFPRVGKNDAEFSKAWKKLLLRFQPLEAGGFVERRDDRWVLTLRGRRMADYVQRTLLLGM